MILYDGTCWTGELPEPYIAPTQMQQEKLRLELIAKVSKWLPKHVLPWFEELINGN